jgi:hypothetical protein
VVHRARLFAILVGLLCSACSGAHSEARTQLTAVSRLDELGFFEYTDRSQLAQVRKQIARDPDAGVFSPDTHRFFFADAEDLAEGGVDELLRELEPTLRRAGVTALSLDENFAEDHYDVVVNGKRYLILSAEQIESDHIWDYAGARTVSLINDLLSTAGSDERAYGYARDNDFGVFLLTPELRDEIAAVVDSPRDEPYEVDDRPPSFGYPGG